MSRYGKLIERVFQNNYSPDARRIPFGREEFDTAADSLKMKRIKNLGDIVYSFRYRQELPQSVQDTSPEGLEWVILGAGVGSYEFRLGTKAKIVVAANRQEIKVPDATPEIVRMYAPGTDEQALLTRVRYNRVLDIFLGLTCYSIQNHLRTTVTDMGQIEVDEIYFGVSKNGAHYVMPCQAKSPGDSFGVAQVYQDFLLCAQRYPTAICRPIAFQFTGENSMAVLELITSEDDDVLTLAVVDEKHYVLEKREHISDDDLRVYANPDA